MELGPAPLVGGQLPGRGDPAQQQGETLPGITLDSERRHVPPLRDEVETARARPRTASTRPTRLSCSAPSTRVAEARLSSALDQGLPQAALIDPIRARPWCGAWRP